MTEPNRDPEPTSETEEKASIHKTHEEFIGDMAQPSISKQEEERRRETERQRAEEKSDRNPDDLPRARPENK